MNDNLLNLESWALQWHCQMGVLSTGFAFFDVRAAFPSIPLSMLWWVLGAVSAPSFITSAVRKLYHRVLVGTNFCGIRKP
eukprot:2965266-Pyramimonas_sp.AAC.1